MTSNLHGLYELGYTRATMVFYKKRQRRELERINKRYLSSDYSLKLENMKEESLVIVNKNVTVNRKTNFVHTARHALGIGDIGNNSLI